LLRSELARFGDVSDGDVAVGEDAADGGSLDAVGVAEGAGGGPGAVAAFDLVAVVGRDGGDGLLAGAAGADRHFGVPQDAAERTRLTPYRRARAYIGTPSSR
jgi:hypothetical protein